MNDKEYMTGAMEIQNIPMEEPRGYSGIRIKMNDDDNDLKEHLAQLIPEEAMPRGDWLNLSDDISYCKNEMERSKENSITENSWSDTQYLCIEYLIEFTFRLHHYPSHRMVILCMCL